MDVFIGITTSFHDGEQRLDCSYAEAVADAGAIPIVLPMPVSEDNARRIVDQLNGLVITGGPAIEEGLIGELPDDLKTTDPVRARSDEQYLALALQAGQPILGICYGMQLLNAMAGGTIYADIEHQQKTMKHSAKRGADMHDIEIMHGTTLSRILGCERISVNTRHIQALASVGGDYRIAARAHDGVIEAIESLDGGIIGVQFHPERMQPAGRTLFRHLVECARHFILQ